MCYLEHRNFVGGKIHKSSEKKSANLFRHIRRVEHTCRTMLTTTTFAAVHSTWTKLSTATTTPARRSATVWSVIENFKWREPLARAALNELFEGLSQAHNLSRVKRQKEKDTSCCNYANFGRRLISFYAIINILFCP